MPPAPAASQSEWGLGQSPKGLFFVFEVVRVDVTVQKVKKMCILESLLLKTPQIWPISDPTPTLTGVSNQKKRVYLPVNTLKTILKVVLKKDTESVLFLCQKDTKKPLKKHPNLQIQKRTIKSQ